ncbi:MAG TPA: hypothetical protein VK815_07445 [Candidatus Acidoferrales bacterium]|jgi:hypothetical protein|nr:hypothetical protein [Candidatus Acidoferrales bacterium]
MKRDPFKKAADAGNTAGSTTVTQKMVEERAGKLAELKGRLACDVTAADLAQARRELTELLPAADL